MKLIIIAALVLIVLAIVFLVNKRGEPNDEVYFAPSSFGDSRVSNLNLKQKPDRDLRILDTAKIEFPEELKSEKKDEYRGVYELQWIVDIVPPEDFLFNKEEFLKVFDYEWRTTFASEFYAHFPSAKKWSFAISGGSPEQFDSLELAVDLASRFRDEGDLTAERLQAYLDELDRRLDSFKVNMDVVPRESLESAVKRSKALRAIQEGLDHDFVVVLKADSKFRSKDVWNTLVDMGLEWGDGDVFHWQNRESEIGGDNFFSVWTTTKPGYFLPEDVAKGKMKPGDLVFGFSIPRSADPIGVYEILMEGVEHCQSELGGMLLDGDGEPFNKREYRKRIEEVIKMAHKHGFELGQGVIMRLI